MAMACNAIGCAFPSRRESAVWGLLGLIVGLVMTLAVVSGSVERPSDPGAAVARVVVE